MKTQIWVSGYWKRVGRKRVWVRGYWKTVDIQPWQVYSFYKKRKKKK